jgi:hypothetical protein
VTLEGVAKSTSVVVAGRAKLNNHSNLEHVFRRDRTVAIQIMEIMFRQG